MSKVKTNKVLLEEIIQRLDVMDQRMGVLEQLMLKLQPRHFPDISRPGPYYFNTTDISEVPNFLNFLNSLFEDDEGL